MSQEENSGNPDFSGFLRKRADKIKIFRSWWFELRGNKLSYQGKKDNKPIETITLGEDAHIIQSRKGNSFIIVGEGIPKNYELTASNKVDLKNWMDKLNNVIMSESSLNIESETKSFISKTQKKITEKDFEKLEEIGKGFYGVVTKVKKKDTAEIFAMKSNRKEAVIKDDMIGLMIAEKNILSKLFHPFIIKLYYTFQNITTLYYVTEFLSGGEMYYHLREEVRFHPNRAKFYVAEIVLALEYLHKHNIIYRNLKPENVMFDFQGHVVLTGFGLAKSAMTEDIGQTQFFSTPEYTAPEMLTNQGTGKSVDWWSLGILLFEMLTGDPPFYSTDVGRQYDLILRAPLKFPKTVPKDAVTFISRLLERDPKKRLGAGPTDATEVKTHAYFKNVDWEKVMKKQIRPPFVPKVKGSDTKYFDREYVDDQLKNSKAPIIQPIDKLFSNFDFQRNYGPSQE